MRLVSAQAVVYIFPAIHFPQRMQADDFVGSNHSIQRLRQYMFLQTDLTFISAEVNLNATYCALNITFYLNPLEHSQLSPRIAFGHFLHPPTDTGPLPNSGSKQPFTGAFATCETKRSSPPIVLLCPPFPSSRFPRPKSYGQSVCSDGTAMLQSWPRRSLTTGPNSVSSPSTPCKKSALPNFPFCSSPRGQFLTFFLPCHLHFTHTRPNPPHHCD